jgi:FMN phosphatase YigB (HAD superfamily)
MLFLDDLRENIIAAKKLKMKTLWCKNPKKILFALKKIRSARKK